MLKIKLIRLEPKIEKFPIKELISFREKSDILN